MIFIYLSTLSGADSRAIWPTVIVYKQFHGLYVQSQSLCCVHIASLLEKGRISKTHILFKLL